MNRHHEPLIRQSIDKDLDSIAMLYRQAFTEDESESVFRLAIELSASSAVENLSLVAELDHGITGHVSFSPVIISGHDECHMSILAPLAVLPEYQRQGLGKALVETGINQLSDKGVKVILVYGDPDYYGRFGFEAGIAEKFTAPYPLAYPFGWQALIMTPCDLPDSPVNICCVAALNNPGLW